MTRKQWLQNITQLFLQKGLDAPKLSAEMLLCFALKIDRVQLNTYILKTIPDNIITELTNLMERRLKGEPIAYIVGKKEFFSRDFYVNPDTLIPRPETELLIDFALDTMDGKNKKYFLDAGTGSGCIATTLCAERPLWKGIALDISINALKIAKNNSQQYSINNQLTFIQANFASRIIKKESLDLYISNPPYIGKEEYLSLSNEILDFEPKTALVPFCKDPFPKGTEAFEDIVYQASICLKKGGLLLIEHGSTQHNILKLLLKNNIWENILFHKDLSKKNRFVSAYKAKQLL